MRHGTGNLLLLFILVSDLFWSRQHRLCAAEASEEMLYVELCLNELLNENPGSFTIFEG